MKILKYVLFTVIGLLLIYIAIGLMNPFVHYSYEFKVNKPLAEAWAVTQDDSKYHQWLDGFKSMELVSGERNTVGSKYKIIVNPGEGQPDFEMIETLIAIEEFEHIEMHFDSDFMDFEQIYSMEEVNGETTVKSDAKVIGKNVFSRSMFALMEILGGSFSAQEAKNMEGLKKVIEENTTDYYPASEPDAPVESSEAVESEQ